MIKNICKDINILKLKSHPATKDDISLGNDLLDTLKFNSKSCVGMALNMIGINKRIIAFIDLDNKYYLMYNPEIIYHSLTYYETVEGCLSLVGQRKTIRYDRIKVKYYDENFKVKIKTYVGFISQIIQHEIDHLEGVLI